MLESLLIAIAYFLLIIAFQLRLLSKLDDIENDITESDFTVWKIIFTIILLFSCNTASAETKEVSVPPIVKFAYSMPLQNIELVSSGKWKRIIDSGEIKGSIRIPEFVDLQEVQIEATSFSYITDRENYNVADYWALPSEFEYKHGGDCEDIAIWKYARLRKMGWKADDLSIWIVTIKESKLQHAILITRINGQEWLLNSPSFEGDNKISNIIAITPEYMNTKFAFAYRFNENGWSTH